MVQKSGFELPKPLDYEIMNMCEAASQANMSLGNWHPKNWQKKSLLYPYFLQRLRKFTSRKLNFLRGPLRTKPPKTDAQESSFERITTFQNVWI
jgi:hypothetical protein